MSPVRAHDAQCQTSNSTSRKNLQTIRDLERDLDDAISRIRQEANQKNVDIFDVDILSIFDPNSNFNSKSPTVLSVQQKLTMPIYEPAKNNWRQLRTLQSRKVPLTLRNQFYERLLTEKAYPECTVTFCPPLSLLNSEESVEALIGFRQQQADQNLQCWQTYNIKN